MRGGWPAVSSFGCSCCRVARGVVVWPAALPFRPPCLRIVLRPLVVSFGPPCRPSAVRVIALAAVSSFGCCGCLKRGVGVSGRGKERGKGKNEPRLSSWPVLTAHWLGLPFPGSPLWLLLPLGVFLHLAGPHPSGEGRGSRGSVVGSELGR